MMEEESHRFQLPFLIPGQAQKEVFHNEALALLDVALHPAVEESGATQPPADPSLGQAWIIGAEPAGAWAGMSGCLAAWTSGGWRFVQPQPGMLAWNKAGGFWSYWTGTGWSAGELPTAGISIGGKLVVGERQPAVPSPSGGTVIDVEARAAVEAIIATLKSHGLTD